MDMNEIAKLLQLNAALAAAGSFPPAPPLAVNQAIANQQTQFQQALLLQQVVTSQQAAVRAANMKLASEIAVARAAEISKVLKPEDGDGDDKVETGTKTKSGSSSRSSSPSSRSRSRSRSRSSSPSRSSVRRRRQSGSPSRFRRRSVSGSPVRYRRDRYYRGSRYGGRYRDFYRGRGYRPNRDHYRGSYRRFRRSVSPDHRRDDRRSFRYSERRRSSPGGTDRRSRSPRDRRSSKSPVRSQSVSVSDAAKPEDSKPERTVHNDMQNGKQSKAERKDVQLDSRRKECVRKEASGQAHDVREKVNGKKDDDGESDNDEVKLSDVEVEEGKRHKEKEHTKRQRDKNGNDEREQSRRYSRSDRSKRRSSPPSTREV